MANILNKKKLISLENYVFFFTKKPEKTYAYTWYILDVQISFRRLTKDGATNKLWLKLSDVKHFIVRLDICQQHNLEMLANLYQHHIFFLSENAEFCAV